MSAWLLPDHIADVLPAEARHIEALRRQLLDAARGYGYELVIPPLIEHLESLLTGTGEALGPQTFKLVDQISGRLVGVRADTTSQAARIDAHLLGRQSVTRLCYCGPVLHTRPEQAHATREPLQFGAEIYGHAGREADLEVLLLALDCLRAARVGPTVLVDLGDARIVRALLAGVMVDPQVLTQVHAALAAKDASELALLTKSFPATSREALAILVQLYGDADVLAVAERSLAHIPGVKDALTDLTWLEGRLPGAKVSFDLADSRGWDYYTGVRFAMYADGAGDAVLRGGRYDGVGAVFGHKLERVRPAVGFSLDVRQLAQVAERRPEEAAIRVLWRDDASQHAAVNALRQHGETVVCVLPGHEADVDERPFDRELVYAAGQWVTRDLPR